MRPAKPKAARKITRQMIEAGVREHGTSCGEEPSASLVAGIYEAMEEARLRASRKRQPSRNRSQQRVALALQAFWRSMCSVAEHQLKKAREHGPERQTKQEYFCGKFEVTELSKVRCPVGDKVKAVGQQSDPERPSHDAHRFPCREPSVHRILHQSEHGTISVDQTA